MVHLCKAATIILVQYGLILLGSPHENLFYSKLLLCIVDIAIFADIAKIAWPQKLYNTKIWRKNLVKFHEPLSFANFA